MKRQWFCIYSLNYVLVNSSNHYVLNNRYDTALDISNTIGRAGTGSLLILMFLGLTFLSMENSKDMSFSLELHSSGLLDLPPFVLLATRVCRTPRS